MASRGSGPLALPGGLGAKCNGFMRRVLLSLVAVTAAVAVALPADAAPAFTTSAKSAVDPAPSRVTQLWQVRVANDGTFDRIVFDLRVSAPGYRVRYVTRVISDPKGSVVPMKGKYFLQIALPGTTTASLAGKPSRVVSLITPNLPEIAQVRKVGEFEQVVSFGIGLNRYRGFRIFRLSNPTRLVLDVHH